MNKMLKAYFVFTSSKTQLHFKILHQIMVQLALKESHFKHNNTILRNSSLYRFCEDSKFLQLF